MKNLNLTAWLKIESYSLITLFCISILISFGKTNPFELIFATGLIILNITLNIIFIINSKRQKSFYYLKIFLDLFSAFIIVQLTGGNSSSFIWVLIFPLVSTILSFEKNIRFIPAIISIVGLFIYLILKPILAKESIAYSESDVLFFLSYSIFFYFINWLFLNSDKNIEKENISQEDSIKNNLAGKNEKTPDNIEKEDSVVLDKHKLDEYKEVVEVAADLANIDHDINNPLTIISLTISRIQLTAKKYNDDKLVKYSNQMSDALSKINKILLRVKNIKNLDLIKEQRRINDEEKNSDS